MKTQKPEPKKKLSSKTPLQAIAERNTTVVKKTRGRYANEETIKAGTPRELPTKTASLSEYPRPRVGFSLGTTLNMDNYESMRIDVWLSDAVGENETIEQAFARVSEIVTERLNKEAQDYMGEGEED